MPITFPASPSVDQTATQNGRTYKWTGAAWEIIGAGSPGVTSINGLAGSPSIVAGSNITVTTAASSITIASAGGSGGGVAMSYLFS